MIKQLRKSRGKFDRQIVFTSVCACVYHTKLHHQTRFIIINFNLELFSYLFVLSKAVDFKFSDFCSEDKRQLNTLIATVELFQVAQMYTYKNKIEIEKPVFQFVRIINGNS